MSTSTGLLNLLTNVQSVESSIATMIFELTLKLSSLTSSSVLLVIESERYRRLAGSSDLVEKYKNNSLFPSITDSLVSLGPALPTSLQERPLIPTTTTTTTAAPPLIAVDRHSAQTGGYPCGGKFGNPLPSPPPASASSVSLPHSELSTNNRASVSTTGAKRKSGSTPDGLPRLKKMTHSDGFDDAASTTTTIATTLKTEPSDDSVELKIVADDAASTLVSAAAAAAAAIDDIPDSDSDIEILEEESCGESGVFFYDHFSASASALVPTTSDSYVSSAPHSSLVGFVDDRFHATSMTTTTTMTMDVGGGGDDVISQMELNAMKIETLKSIRDPTLPFQKGTLECRLISSLFYDFGKELRRLSPIPLDFSNPDHRQYFARHVDAFMDRFPNLGLGDPASPVARLKVEVGSDKRYTPAAFLRVNARNGFKARAPKAPRAEKRIAKSF